MRAHGLGSMAVFLALCASACREHARPLPVEVHLLQFDGSAELSTRTSEAEARRVIAEVNRSWLVAGVALVITAVRKEKGLPDMTAMQWLATWQPTGDEKTIWRMILDHLALVRPPVATSPGTLHIYFIGALPSNGIWMPPSGLFVRDQPVLTQVAGGAREPRARVLAHELGHAFGIDHASEPDRLMFPGSSGQRISDADIATAHRFVNGGGRAGVSPSISTTTL